MKRKLSVMLLAVLMLQTVSCAESSENTEAAAETAAQEAAVQEEAETTAEEEEKYISDGLGDHDFGGYEVRFAVTEPIVQDTLFAEDFTGEPVVDALRTSNLYIEDRFNVKLSCEIYPNELIAFQNVISAGDDAFDVEKGSDWILYPMAQKGMFFDLYDIEQFDLTKPWWPANLTEILTINGSMYTSANYLSYMGLHWTRVLFICKDYAEILNLELPYDTIREGNWTLDAMFAYVDGATIDANGDGVIGDDDNKAFVTGTQTFYCLQEALGISPYSQDENGKIILDFNVEKIDSYVTKMREFMATDNYYQADDFFGHTFRFGKTLLCYGQLGDAYDVYKGEDLTYGFLTTPKLDELQEDYINCCTDTPWALPITLSDEQIDIVGTVCEAMSCYNYQNILPAYYDVAMKSRLSDSPDDAEMLQLIADTRTTSFSFAYGLQYNNILGDLKSNDTGVSSYYQSKLKAADRLLEKTLADFEKIKENRG